MTEWYLIGNKIREGLTKSIESCIFALSWLLYTYIGFEFILALSVADFHRSISKRFLSYYKYWFCVSQKSYNEDKWTTNGSNWYELPNTGPHNMESPCAFLFNDDLFFYKFYKTRCPGAGVPHVDVLALSWEIQLNFILLNGKVQSIM